MATKLCPACRGAKKIMGIGFMNEADCRVCAGIGHVPEDVPKLEEEIKEDYVLLEKPVETKVTAKKSRKVKTDSTELMDGSKEIR